MRPDAVKNYQGNAMSHTVRAVYDHGSLRLLDEVEHAEGQEVHVVMLSQRDRARIALGDLLVDMPEPPGAAEIDEAALLEEVAEALRGLPPLSEAIIAERRESAWVELSGQQRAGQAVCRGNGDGMDPLDRGA